MVKLPVQDIGIDFDGGGEKVPVKIQHSRNTPSEDKIDGHWYEQGDKNLKN